MTLQIVPKTSRPSQGVWWYMLSKGRANTTAEIRRRLFSICANSASCEHLFSLSSTLLTKLRSSQSEKPHGLGIIARLSARRVYADGRQKGLSASHKGNHTDPLPSSAIVTADSVPNDLLSEAEQPETQDEDVNDDENSLGHITSAALLRRLGCHR
ncbi:hypothetical protein BDR07DRAFT_210773 [Suillus spraguei]|nr:hypothetical protein BDR07DRAFT_210773 [Suillus spraguei]